MNIVGLSPNMNSFANWGLILLLGLACTFALNAQNGKTPASQPASQPSVNEGWTTKTFDVKYIDPEQVREVFSSQSHVMEANRELKLLTARGSATFLREVEDTIKRLDVPPPLPPNTQITVYLIATAPQSPTGVALPAELKALEKDLPAKMADMQMLRVRIGQGAETAANSEPAAAPAVSLSRIHLDSSSVNQGPKGDIVSINGLKVWINIPPADPASAAAKTPKTQPDVAVDLDLNPNEAAIVAKIGVDKPLAIVVRASVIR
jgi:hypothetical protein